MDTTTAPVKPAAGERGPSRAIALLSIGHAVDDLYQGAVPALIPFFTAARHWDYATASWITVAATVLSAVVQPLFGLLTDRRSAPWLVPAGMGLAGVGVGLSGLSTSYVVTLIAVALSGLGVAAYHPESARLARVAARGSHVSMSWFSLGGNIGFAFGPVLVAAVLGTLGVSGTAPLAVPALLWAVVTFASGRRLQRAHAAARPAGAVQAPPRNDWAGFARLSVPVVARSIVTASFGTFLALFVERRLGAGTATGETALVVFYGVGAAGTLLGGRLAGRYGRIATVRAAYVASVVCVAGVWLVPGPAVFAAIAAASVALYVPFSIHVTLGQDYLPGRVGTASGVTLGLAVSIGGLVAPVVGTVADHAGLTAAIACLTSMPVLSALVGLTMKEPVPPAGDAG
ncbi:MFS transporter [Streptomyces sp. 8L]|uniref:MFS transporter n=1 Tax=Streptomyces sp. 8L TaxID=2877242 RepID=UPI001CD1DFA8|nr:MFS transporter [Streptomyces sp. 8L]MCA1224026.1 MFS transporter [Streptomyces sp. 8L]